MHPNCNHIAAQNDVKENCQLSEFFPTGNKFYLKKSLI